MASDSYPTTPDGRYFVVRGRLWRKANPALPQATSEELVSQLMTARRALRKGSPVEGRPAAKAAVNAAKTALGERGPVWWTNGEPDYNRKLVKNTPYSDWFTGLGLDSDEA